MFIENEDDVFVCFLIFMFGRGRVRVIMVFLWFCNSF